MTLENRSGSNDETALRLARAVMAEAERRPWLAGVLLRRPDWIERLSQWAAGLRELPRRTRRALLRGTAVAALLLALAGGPAPAYAATVTVGDGTPASCTELALDTALGAALANDTITFNCGGPKTITLLSGKSISLPKLTIDGGKLITLDGGGTEQVLAVDNGSELVLQNITITNGNGLNGGGIQNLGTLTIENSTITNNIASGVGLGGGVFNYTGASLTINNSTISGNTAVSGGGIYVSGSASVTISNSTISGNDATDGGGIFVYSGSSVTLTNSTISGNTATMNGGAIVNNYGNVVVKQGTITDNQATGVESSGGGVFSSPSYTTFTSSIIAGNTAYGVSNDCNSNQADGGYNIEGGTSCFAGPVAAGTQQNIVAANLLEPLSLNATLTGTQTHALKSGSAGVDMIPVETNGCGLPPLDADQRGAVRAGEQTPGDHKGGTFCDVGAYEFDSRYDPTTVTVSRLGAQSSAPFGAAGLLGGALAVLAGAVGWFKLRRAR